MFSSSTHSTPPSTSIMPLSRSIDPSLSIIQQIRPAFHHQGGTVEAKKETEEAVWLQNISRLTGDDIGITDDSLLAKFKALLIIQSHQLFFMREEWQKSHAKFLLQKIQTEVQKYQWSLGKSISRNIIQLTDLKCTHENLELARSALQSMFTPVTNELKSFFEQCFMYENELHLTADVIFQEKQAYTTLADDLEKVAIDYFLKHNMLPSNLSFQKVIHQALGYNLFKKNVVNGAYRFNINEIKKIVELKNLEVAPVLNACGFASDLSATNRHENYIQFYKEYLNLVNDTLGHIQQIEPEFTDEKFSIYYQNAFNVLFSTKLKFYYVESFLYELYLQLARKPHIQGELYEEIVEIYLPAANLYYQQENLGITISTIELDRWMRHARHEKNFPESMHKIIDDAYKLLHNLQSNEKVENDDKPIENSTATINIVENYSNILSTLPTQLFNGDAPGTLMESSLDVVTKIAQCNAYYENLFSHLSREQGIETKSEDNDDRSMALTIFREELAKLTTPDSLENIASLIAVAKPYLNRHRHYFWSTLTHTAYANTCREAFLQAQTQALDIVKQAFSKSPIESRALLEKWQNQSLFTNDYRVNNVFSNLWSKPKSPQEEIQEMLETIKKLSSHYGAPEDTAQKIQPSL